MASFCHSITNFAHRQPQRPSRNLRIYDENAINGVPPSKTIHQRNKSSPALSTLANVGLRAAAKRTAFGDLSNTANLFRPSKDDSAIIGLREAAYSRKENVAPVQEKKSSTFQKPAQRAPTVSGLKNILNNVTNPLNQQPCTKPPPVSGQQQLSQISVSQATQPNHIGPKKSISIFKHEPPAARPLPELPNDAQKPLPSAASNATSEPVQQEVLPRPLTDEARNSSVVVKEPSRHVFKHYREPSVSDEKIPNSTDELEPDATPVPTSDGIYIDENGEVQVYDCSEPPQDREAAVDVVLALPTVAIPVTAYQTTRVPLSDKIPNSKVGLVEPVSKNKLASVPEPEEYWEDEDAAEVYEEDEGFVTARSFKTRGDSTIGGATTILFPKQTQRARREIALAKELIEGSKTPGELEDEAWDTTMVAEYSDEIFGYMKELEIKMLPNAHYMDNQQEIQWSMRAVLMDWIIQVHHRFSLLPETLYLCVNYIDRFLSCKVVSLGKLQLVGATAIFIAAKYEEIDCPSIQEIVYMVDGGYTVDEILKAERFMLSMLQFELGWPGPMSFLRRISKADDYDLESRTLAKYFLEITVMDERFVGSPPSFAAAGAHCLARMMLRKGTWVSVSAYNALDRQAKLIADAVSCTCALFGLHLWATLQSDSTHGRML